MQKKEDTEMPTEIHIPEVSATRDTTILLKWFKRER